MTNGILTLIDAFFPKGLHLHLYWQCIPNLHFKGIAPNFQAEHFLFHSQLLKKSNFVSFPPLTYMLKFSRFGCLNSRHAMQFGHPQKGVFDILRSQQNNQSQCKEDAIQQNMCVKHCMPHTIKSTRQEACKPSGIESSTPLGISQRCTPRSNPNNSRISAIHNEYHVWLHPSSSIEPRHSLLKFACP